MTVSRYVNGEKVQSVTPYTITKDSHPATMRVIKTAAREHLSGKKS